MREITLFDFQTDAKNFLLDMAVSGQAKKKIVMKAPTGAGKTIILLSFIEDYRNYADDKKIFVWLTPGKGDLEEQSKKKLESLIPDIKTGSIHDILLQGFVAGTVYFINWEMITNKKNNALKEGEKKNLFERIAAAHRSQYSFITIIDEEHLNDTKKADDILSAMNAEREIRVSATASKNYLAEYYEIPEEEVINSGLITKALYINQDIEIDEIDDLDSETMYLVQKADDKRKEVKQAYERLGLAINPLVIIQFPDMSTRLIAEVEEKLEEMGYTYQNGLVSKWLSNDKINITGIEMNNALPNFLIMKQAIATGWDCPRAKILVKLRENMSETFEIQTLGRLRRMPEAKHYEEDILDFCYLYTFDEKYKEAALQTGNAYEVKRLFLKKEYEDFELEKEVRNQDYQLVGEKEVLIKSYDYLKEKYRLTDDYKENQRILENHGYIFGTRLNSTFKSGKYQKLSDIIHDGVGERREISYEVSTHEHGIDCLHAIDMIKKVFTLKSQKTKSVLQHLFHKMIRSDRKLIALSNREWYAFMINNARRLRDDFLELSATGNGYQLEFLFEKRETWKLPREDFYKYLPNETEVSVYHKNVYKDYDTSMTSSNFRSLSEQLLENYLEQNDGVLWFYKNGDKGQQYLSILYGNGIGKEYLFYPDYIVKMKNGDTWILETKGGEYQGVSKNIDRQVENKFTAFEAYAKRNKVQWGFVRDKDTRLFINNTKYTEEMGNDKWIELKKVL